MRKWLILGLTAFILSGCKTLTSLPYLLNNFPIDSKRNYVVWRFDSSAFFMVDTFCKVSKNNSFKDCSKDKNSNPNKLFFGQNRVSFQHDGHLYFIGYSEQPRRGRFALYKSEGSFTQSTQTLEIEDATYHSNFAPGTVTVIPYGDRERPSHSKWIKSLRKALNEAFGPRAAKLKIVTAKKQYTVCSTLPKDAKDAVEVCKLSKR
ncbi:hypothetical protein [Pseudovibrio denitrificans]|nr:hypothetical protein [Pseudovibrio denitrificans]